MTAALDSLDTALALPDTKGTPLPIFTGQEMTRALTAYRELQQALDRAMPDQIMSLDGKPFRKKGYWRAIAVAFNLTVEPVTERREVHGELADGSDNYVYLVTYRASTPTGRAATGDGACAAGEKQRGRMKASEHNVRSHAHTRAMNRAVSNLVAFGEVSAEEVEREDSSNGRPAAARPVGSGSTAAKPTGFDAWLVDMEAKADEGNAAFYKAWNEAPKEQRRYLSTHAATTWEALKARAAKAGTA